MTAAREAWGTGAWGAGGARARGRRECVCVCDSDMMCTSTWSLTVVWAWSCGEGGREGGREREERDRDRRKERLEFDATRPSGSTDFLFNDNFPIKSFALCLSFAKGRRGEVWRNKVCAIPTIGGVETYTYPHRKEG